MAFATKITIDGTDVSSYVLLYRISDSIDEPTFLEMRFSNDIVSTINLTSEQNIVVYRGTVTSTDYTIFNGYISTVNKDSSNYTIEGYDKLWILQRKTVNKSYDKDIDTQAGVISAIAQDLIETYGGLTADVENSGTINVVSKFICRNDFVIKKLNVLKDILDWQVYYDPMVNKVLFKSKGTTIFSTNVQIGVNTTEVPEWKYDYSKIANDVTVIGGFQEIETTESGQIGVTTGYTTSSITLNFTPESVKVYADNANPPTTLRRGGVEDQTEIFDYSVDKVNKKILWNSGTYAPIANDRVEVRYSYLIPVKVHSKNNASISSYGLHESVRKIETLTNVDDAEKKVSEILNKFSNPVVSSNIKIYNVYGIQAGHQIHIVDTINNEIRDVIVRKIVYNYPVIIDEIQVDNAPIYEDYIYNQQIISRLEQLERKNQTDDELIYELINIYPEVQQNKRYFKLQKQTINDANALVWGHPTQGTWNSFNWNSSAFGAATTQKIVQGNMIYEEYVYDSDFHDAINSTATFNTGTNQITFTAGQIWYSSAIDLGTTLTQVRLDLGTVSGTLTYEISSDNKSTWQTLTEATLTTLSSSNGLGTYLKITAAGVASISRTNNIYGQATEPNIKLTMVE